MDKTFEINESLLASTLNYLAARPYAEVANLINALQHLNTKVEKDESKDS